MVDYVDSLHPNSMPPLLEKLRGKVFAREKESLRIVVLGSPGVGKTGKFILSIWLFCVDSIEIIYNSTFFCFILLLTTFVTGDSLFSPRFSWNHYFTIFTFQIVFSLYKLFLLYPRCDSVRVFDHVNV